MSNYIKDALLEGGYHKKLRDESQALVSKWDKTGLLEGLDGDYNKSSMAILLENQAKQLIDETSRTGANSGAQNSEEWSGVALPLVRRIFAEIAAQDFVSVQPMNLPSGLVFFLDFKYGSSAFSGNGRSSTESLAGKTGPNSPLNSSGTYPEGGFYGAGKFEYTMPTASLAVNVEKSATTLAELNYDTDASSSLAGKVCTVTVDAFTDATYGTYADKTTVRAWQLQSTSSTNGLNSSGSLVAGVHQGGVTGGGVHQQYTTSGSALVFVVPGESTTTTEYLDGSLTLVYYKQPIDYNRGDFEDGNYNSAQGAVGGDQKDLPIPEINLEMKSLPIVAKTRKLKAIWTPELAQDLNAYHSVDAEAELTAMLSEYISMEIDLEILDMLINDAVTTDKWSAKLGVEWNGTAFDNATNINGYAYTKKDWYQTLGTKIQKVSNKIHQLTLRGGANFVVCSPQVATVIESIEGFGASTDGNQSNFAMGVRQVGALSNRWTVYKNPYMTDNTILLGYRGTNFLETGAVYAPYVPLIMTPLVYDPVNFTPRKGVMTRYAKKMVRPEFYGKIQVHGLETI